MKVLLINPPSRNEILSCNPTIVKDERGFDPPLGLLYLAGYLKTHAAYQLKIIDAQVEKLDYPQIAEQIKKYGPEVIGITAMTFTMIDVLKTIAAAKQAWPSVKIILGGPHPQIYPHETINLPNVDYVVLGEGEETFYQLLQNLNNPEALKQIPGLVFKNGAQVINTGQKNFIFDLDGLPEPPRELVPYTKYFSLLAKAHPITTMFTSRGCPFRCTFCDRPNMGNFFRYRNAKNVVDEMEHCLKLGIKEIFVYDDTFTVSRQRVIDICREILRRQLKFNWDIRARVNTVDREVLTYLKKAGCVRIHYGVEAGTEKILKVLNKGISLEQVLRVFKMTRKMGIDTLAYFMIGSPTETKEDILATIKFAKKLNPDYAQITMLTPFPGTKIYQQALNEKIYPDDYWQKFAQNPQPGFQTQYWTKELSLDELKKLLTRFYKEFYLRPSYIFKRMIKIKSWPELLRKINAGFNVIKMKSHEF